MKKRILQRISALLTVMVLFISVYVPVAAEALTVNAMTTIGVLSAGNPYGYALDVQRINLSGNIAFCIEPNSTMMYGHTYTQNQSEEYWQRTLNGNQRDWIGLILYYGYYNNASSHRTDAYLAATQLLCWEVTGFNQSYKKVSPLRTFNLTAHTSSCSNSLLNYYAAQSGGPSKSAVTTAYNAIVNSVKAHRTAPSNTYASSSTASSTANRYTLTYNSSTRRYQKTIKCETALWDAFGMTTAIKNAGLNVTSSKVDSTYTNYTIYSASSFTTAKTAKGTKNSTSTKPYGGYSQVMVYKNATVGSSSGQTAVLGAKYDPVYAYMSFIAPITTGSYSLTKFAYDPERKSTGIIASYMDNYDEVRSELIRFYIVTSGGTPIRLTGSNGAYTYSGNGTPTQMMLNTSGTLQLNSLPYGTYRLYEVAASGKSFEDYGLETPTGYTSFTISSPSNGGVVTNRMKPHGSLNIRKTFTLADGSTAPNSFYKNCSFRIKNSDGKYIKLALDDAESGSYSFDSIVTSAGEATLVKLGTSTKTASIDNLELGTYTVEEVMSGNAFTAKAASQNATLTSDSTVTVTFQNVENSGELNVHKITEGGTDLGGIRFTFSGTSASGRRISVSGITDDDGNLSFKNIPIGKNYTLEEDRSTVPVGYVTADPVTGVVIEYNEATDVDIKNDETDIFLSKKKLTGEDELPGASLQIIDASGEIIEEWVSTDKPHELKGVLAAGETYTLREEAAPDGYVISEDIEFTVSENGDVDTVVMRDAPTYVSISKKTLSGEDELPGAKMQILNTKGNVIEEWVSTDKPHETIGKLIAGEKYILHEETAPDGYVVAQDISFSVSDDGSVDTVIMRDAPTVVWLSKKTLTGEDELPGATLQIIDSNGKVIEEWVSSDKPHIIEAKLIAGASYVLHEEAAPDGYVISQDIPFTVSLDGSTVTIEMKDAPTTVELSKKKITGDDELPGAKLQVIDSKGNVVERWTSSSTPHIITARLVAGATYTLQEEAAPAGYVIANDITFTVSTDGSVDKVEMKDDTTKVQISKKAITGDNELVGAKLQVKDSAGKVVDEWISGDKPHMIEGKLTAGEKYTLHEEIAPDGYVVANDIEFTVSNDGSVDVVEMKDDTTKVQISKKAITGDNELVGAKLQVKDSAGNIVDEWTSTEEPHMIEGKLVAGQNYTLHEEISPNGYAVASDITFTVSTDGQIDKVEMKDDITKVHISKVDAVSGETLVGAVLQVIDAEGTVIDEWTSEEEPHEIEGVLVAGATYILHEATAPEGYVLAEDSEFVVPTTGDIIEIVMEDDRVRGTIEITKSDLNDSAMLIPNCLVEITDLDKNTIDSKYTDELGIATFELEYGEYYYHEVEAPEGYNLNEEYFKFAITEDGVVIKEVLYDIRITGTIRITKSDIDDHSQLIPNCKIEILDADKNIIITDVTDEFGVVEFTLPYGTYYYHEVNAPTGYYLNDEYFEFSITENGVVIEKTLYDTKIPSVPKTGTAKSPIVPLCAGATLMTCCGLLVLTTKKSKKD